MRWACASACSWTRCRRPWRAARAARRRPRRALHRDLRRARTARRQQAAVLARFAGAAEAALRDGPGRQRRPRPEPRQPDRLPARRARRAGGLDRPRPDRRRARARPDARRCATTCAASSARHAAGADDLRHRHRHLRHPPHRGARWRGAASASPRRCSAPHELEVFRARRARVAARGVALPGHALLGQGGLLQGHRPGHAHADDLARLRDRQRAQRQARDPPARRAGRLVRARAACAPTSA